MEPINTAIDLRAAILQLEAKQAEEGKVLKEQLLIAYDSVQPINLLKSTVNKAAASQEIQDKILTTTVGLAAGYVSKKVFEGVSHGPLRHLLGTALMFGITRTVSNNPEAVRAMAKGVLKLILHKATTHVHAQGVHGQGHDAYTNEKMKFDFPIKGFESNPS